VADTLGMTNPTWIRDSEPLENGTLSIFESLDVGEVVIEVQYVAGHDGRIVPSRESILWAVFRSTDDECLERGEIHTGDATTAIAHAKGIANLAACRIYQNEYESIVSRRQKSGDLFEIWERSVDGKRRLQATEEEAEMDGLVSVCGTLKEEDPYNIVKRRIDRASDIIGREIRAAALQVRAVSTRRIIVDREVPRFVMAVPAGGAKC
jgi:hypothetical protein